MTVTGLLVDRKPLYQVMSFYQNYDLETLFTERFDVSALNDDALGRMLDRLTEIDRCQLVQSVALCALRVGEMEVRSVHADTTSITVQGEYNSIQHDPSANSEEKTLNITQGYSKQHRPDLKQFGCGLIVSQDGMPVFGWI
jgi:transposase